MFRLLTLSCLVCLVGLCLVSLVGCEPKSIDAPVATSKPAAKAAAKPNGATDAGKVEPSKPAAPTLAAIAIELPKPQFKGTPKHAKSDNLEAPRKGARPAFMAPAGCKLLSSGAAVTSSDPYPVIGEVDLVTDGDKEANEGSYVELGPKAQYVQVDLGASHAIHAVVIWQFHMNARIYKDVVVRVSDDADFVDYTTVFNNDHDNSSGFGVGEHQEYWETNEGKLIDAEGKKGRYIRVYSHGNTEDELNHFTEVEVWGV